MSPRDSVEILGVRIDRTSWQGIDDFCRETLTQSKPRQIVTVNGEFILEAQKNLHFRQAINGADLAIPDSTNVVWASHYLRAPLPQLTPGSDLTMHLAELAEKNNKSVFLLGAQEGVAQKAADELKKTYPNLMIAGTSSADPEPATIEIIKKARPDILLVAYPAPIQVTWISDNKAELPCRIIVGVGGTFDMLAGVLPRAPRSLRALHFEWLWRLIIQPSRWRRSWNALVVFPTKVIFSKNS